MKVRGNHQRRIKKERLRRGKGESKEESERVLLEEGSRKGGHQEEEKGEFKCKSVSAAHAKGLFYKWITSDSK